jgi:hydrogenase expression/formation protein HypD
VIFCSFGDMLRVPGSSQDLFRVKSEGGDVRVVYSPLDALKIARENPDRQVVFFGIGFETTAPANAMTVYQAKTARRRELLAAGVARAGAAGDRRDHGVAGCRVQAFLAAGHVCSVMGTGGVPAAGREVPGADRGHRLRAAGHPGGHPAPVVQLESGRHELENAYPRAVRAEGNPAAMAMLRDVFEVTDRTWRGIGMIPAAAAGGCPSATATSTPSTGSTVTGIHTEESPLCRSGEVLQGLLKPHECAAFGKQCTPRNPLGATMVSSEGACAAYYLYRRLDLEAAPFS